jgi:hypothetical protein
MIAEGAAARTRKSRPSAWRAEQSS